MTIRLGLLSLASSVLTLASTGCDDDPAPADPPASSAARVPTAMPASVDVSFAFEDVEADEPTSRVLLVVAAPGTQEQRTDLGRYEGGCSEPSMLSPEPTPLLSASCYHAGAGVEIVVRAEGGVLVAQRRDYDEGDEEGAPPPGTYRTITRVELPPGATPRAAQAAEPPSSRPDEIPASWSRVDLRRGEHAIPVTIAMPQAVEVEVSEVGYGAMDGESDPERVVAADLATEGFTLRIEQRRGDDAVPATASEAIANRNLTNEMVVTSGELPDGGWFLAWTGTTPGELWLEVTRHTPAVVCNSNGAIRSRAHLDDALRACRSIEAAQ